MIMISSYLKLLLAPILFRNIAPGLKPRRLNIWFDCLAKTHGLRGDVLEVGVASGGTAIWSHKFLRQGGDTRHYVCVDTFAGFVREHFERDVELGNSWNHFSQFTSSPMFLVRKILVMYDADDISLIRGDISQLHPSNLPSEISACLLDVDLAVPIYDALKLVWPVLQSGGFIAVDDCTTHSGDWQALKGLQKFCVEKDISPLISHGMGIVQKAC